MNYTTQDAIDLQNRITRCIKDDGPDTAHFRLLDTDPELLALTLLLATLSR